jgi:hypothetical protein
VDLWEAGKRGFSDLVNGKKKPVDNASAQKQPARGRPMADDEPNPDYKGPSPATVGVRSINGARRYQQEDEQVQRMSNGLAPDNGNQKDAPVGYKRGGATKKPGGGGLGALAALQGVMGGGGAGGPPGVGGPPMPPPGAGGGMPPPGMKRGGHVSKNAGGKPHEDMPLRQAKRKAKEFPADGGTTHEEKSSAKGAFKYAKGGRVAHHGPHGDDETFDRGGTFGGDHGHGKGVVGGDGHRPSLESLHKAHGDHVKKQAFFAKGGVTGEPKGRALDKADGGTTKEEKGSAKGEMRYAKGGHVTGFRGSAHGIESRGKTKGRYI